MILVYGGLLLVVILALLGIFLLLRETKPTTRKVRAQEPGHSATTPASAIQVELMLHEQVDKTAEGKMESRVSSSTFSLPSNVTSVQSLPRNDVTPLVTRSTGVVPTVTHMPHASHLIKVDDDRIALTPGQFGALLSELHALRQRSEEMAERLDIVSETLEQMAPTQIEFPAISFKSSPASDTPGSAHRGRQFIN